MLFGDQRHHSLTLPARAKDGRPSTIALLIDYICEDVMKDTRKELFVLDNRLYVSFLHAASRPRRPFAACLFVPFTPRPLPGLATSNGDPYIL